MDLLNYKAFVLGVFLLILMLLCNLLYCLFCVTFKIKILEFSVFAFRIKKVTIKGIDYTLGWGATMCSIKPFGMDPDLFDRTLSETELNTAFFTKEDSKKAFVLFSPSIIYFVFGLVLPMIYFKIHSGYGIDQHVHYIIEFFKTIVGDESQIKNFGLLTKMIVLKNSTLLFSFLLFSSAMFVWSLIQNYSGYLKWKQPKSKALYRFFTVVYVLFSVFLLTIPMTLLHYFSFAEISLLVLNILIGIFSSGVILYLLLICCLKIYYKGK